MTDEVRRPPARRLRARASTVFDLVMFGALVWAYAIVLFGLMAIAAGGRVRTDWFPVVLLVGGMLLAYLLAVQTVAWWRRRESRQ